MPPFALMRKARYRISYLVGVPKGRRTRLERSFQEKPSRTARERVAVKLAGDGDDLFVPVNSEDWVVKERSMRRRRMKVLVRWLKEFQWQRNLSRDKLLERLGQAKQHAGRAYGLFNIEVPEQGGRFDFRGNRKELRLVLQRKRCYLRRSNLTAEYPARRWVMYAGLVETVAEVWLVLMARA